MWFDNALNWSSSSYIYFVTCFSPNDNTKLTKAEEEFLNSGYLKAWEKDP